MIAPIGKVRHEGNCGRVTNRGKEACECVRKCRPDIAVGRILTSAARLRTETSCKAGVARRVRTTSRSRSQTTAQVNGQIVQRQITLLSGETCIAPRSKARLKARNAGERCASAPRQSAGKGNAGCGELGTPCLLALRSRFVPAAALPAVRFTCNPILVDVLDVGAPGEQSPGATRPIGSLLQHYLCISCCRLRVTSGKRPCPRTKNAIVDFNRSHMTIGQQNVDNNSLLEGSVGLNASDNNDRFRLLSAQLDHCKARIE